MRHRGPVDIQHNADGLIIKGANVEVSDEYHSMQDLYEHRLALTVALFNAWERDMSGWAPFVWRAREHSDGTMFEGGYFIVGANTEQGQISYHYKLEHWDRFDGLTTLQRAPKYDGHTSADVIRRLFQQ